jgi:hypothetical protein
MESTLVIREGSAAKLHSDLVSDLLGLSVGKRAAPKDEVDLPPGWLGHRLALQARHLRLRVSLHW